MKHKVWCIISNIKNGLLSKKKFLREKKHNNCEAILTILWDEGFIVGYRTCSFNSKYIIIILKYTNNNSSLKSIKSISKPSLKIYYSANQLWKLNLKQSLIILSTSKGIYSSNECKRLNIGGEPFLILK